MIHDGDRFSFAWSRSSLRAVQTVGGKHQFFLHPERALRHAVSVEKLDHEVVRKLVLMALDEDSRLGDVTTLATVPAGCPHRAPSGRAYGRPHEIGRAHV